MSKDQIEETTCLLWHFPKALFLNCYNDCKEVAELLYKEGYRKQKKGFFKIIKPRRENRNATYICSVCGALCSSYYNDVGNWKFCPHCGANMKGEAK